MNAVQSDAKSNGRPDRRGVGDERRERATMVVAIVVSVLVLPAVLAALVVVLSTAGYTARVPGGSDAMGLALPLFMSAGAGLALVIAAWVCVAGGRLDWISQKPLVPLVAATVASAGVGLASVGVLIAWMEKMGAWVPPVGLVCGALGPLCVGVMLLCSAWLPRPTIQNSALPIIAGIPVVVVAAAGLGGAVFGLFSWMKLSSENAGRVLAQESADQAERARRDALAPIDALREDYAKMSDDAPLWVFVAGLPARQEPECRAFIIERALRVPDFERDFEQTINADWPIYRHGCADLIRFAPESALRPAWAGCLAKAITISASEIERDPEWFTPRYDRNPDPVAHVRAMADAASRLGATPVLTEALGTLAHAIERAEAPTHAVRETLDTALAALHAGADRTPDDR